MEIVIKLIEEFGLPVAIAIITSMALIVFIKKIFAWIKELFEDGQSQERKNTEFLQTSHINMQAMINKMTFIIEQNSDVMREFTYILKSMKKGVV